MEKRKRESHVVQVELLFLARASMVVSHAVEYEGLHRRSKVAQCIREGILRLRPV